MCCRAAARDLDSARIRYAATSAEDRLTPPAQCTCATNGKLHGKIQMEGKVDINQVDHATALRTRMALSGCLCSAS